MTINNRAALRMAILLGAFAMGVQDFPQIAALGPDALPYTPLLPSRLAKTLLDLVGATSPNAVFIAALTLYATALPVFMLMIARDLGRSRPQPPRGLFMSIAAQVMLGVIFCDDWLLFVAIELALLLPRRVALRCLLAQILAYAMVQMLYSVSVAGGAHLACGAGGHFIVLTPRQRIVDHALEVARESAFQWVAFGVGLLAAAERRRRIQLAALHAQTKATQQLLRDTTQSQERKRLAREVHDVLGHQLTAINLHLDIALRRTTEPGEATVHAARSLAQQLLADVRHLVSVERGRRGGGLTQAVQLMCDTIAAPRLHVSIAPELEGVTAADGQAIIRHLKDSLQHDLEQASDVAIYVSVTLDHNGARYTILRMDDAAMVQDVSPHGNTPAQRVWIPLAGEMA